MAVGSRNPGPSLAPFRPAAITALVLRGARGWADLLREGRASELARGSTPHRLRLGANGCAGCGWPASDTFFTVYACRFCRTSIASTEGCAVCLEFKVHLVALDEDEREHPGLAEVSSETVAALRGLLREARNGLREAEPRDPAERTAWLARLDRSRGQILRASNSLAKVLEAARKLQQDGLGVIRTMGFVQRAELFVEWWKGLPPGHRDKLDEHMAKWKAEQARPALPEGAP